MRVAAAEALERATVARQEAEDRRPAVEATVERLRRLRAENNFAPRFQRAMEGGDR